jgi:type II secretory pathway component PulK
MKIARTHAQRRGSMGLYLVLSMGAMLAVAVMASGSRITPAAREARRTETSDRAWSAAEGGLALARAMLVDEPSWEGRREFPVGEAQVELVVTRRPNGERLAVSSARVQDPAGPAGAWVTRVLEARIVLGPSGTLRVLDWQER